MADSLLQALQQTVNEQKTGIAFLVSMDKRSAQISFLDGKAVYAMSQGKKGREAVELIAQMEIDRHRFQEGAIPPTRAEMPSTEELVRLLREGGGASLKQVPPKRPMAVPSASAVEKKQSPAFSEAQKAVIQDVLAECIGPMAIILCEEHFATAQTAEEAIEHLASELPASQVATFREQVQRKL